MVLVRYYQHDRLLDDLSVRFHQSDLKARIRRIGVEFEAGRTVTHWFDSHAIAVSASPSRLVARVDACRVTFLLTAEASGSGPHLPLDIHAYNGNPGPVRLLRHLIEVEVEPPSGATLQPAEVRWLRNGWQSWSFAGVLTLESSRMAQPRFEWIRAIKEDPLVPADEAPFVSDMVTALRLGDNALVVGAANQTCFQRIRVEPARSPLQLTLEIDLDREPMHPGQSLQLGSWCIEGEHTATYLVREWARRRASTDCGAGTLPGAFGADTTPAPHSDASDSANRPVGRAPPRGSSPSASLVATSAIAPTDSSVRSGSAGRLVGWCSWYDRKRNITHDYIRRTVERIRSTPELAPLSTVIIDDGYQERVGDWLVPAARYGAKVAESARLIREAGLTAGIWVAPFVAQGGSRLIEQHPEWVATRNGRPCRLGFNPHWRSTFYALDVRNEEFLEHLSQLFSQLSEAGFRVFKLDYLYPAALPLDRSPAAPGRFAAFRNAVTRIRRAVAGDSYLLGCGCPLAPSIGLFDAVRVSTDIDYCWKSPALLEAATGDEEMVGIFPAARNTLVRSTFGQAFWHVDPDCVLLAQGRGSATQGEKALFARLAAMAGDVVLVGDDLARWGCAELSSFRESLARHGTRFVPLDAADRPDPTWAFASGSGWTSVAAFNLGDRKEMLSVQRAHLRSLADEIAAVCTLPPTEATLHPDRIAVSPIESRTAVVVDVRFHAVPAPQPGLAGGTTREDA
ncbi:MAG: alpha-galactosidase [Deltaproteobacteria bacterium]|nr:alpha-galactosidase [Deltaproteobacteria bacterium]